MRDQLIELPETGANFRSEYSACPPKNKRMTKLLWIALSIGIAILTVLAFTFFAPFPPYFSRYRADFFSTPGCFCRTSRHTHSHPRRPQPIKNFPGGRPCGSCFSSAPSYFVCAMSRTFTPQPSTAGRFIASAWILSSAPSLMSRCLTGKTPGFDLSFAA